MIDSGRGAARAEGALVTPTQSHISPSLLVYEDKFRREILKEQQVCPGEDVREPGAVGWRRGEVLSARRREGAERPDSTGRRVGDVGHPD